MSLALAIRQPATNMTINMHMVQARQQPEFHHERDRQAAMQLHERAHVHGTHISLTPNSGTCPPRTERPCPHRMRRAANQMVPVLNQHCHAPNRNQTGQHIHDDVPDQMWNRRQHPAGWSSYTEMRSSWSLATEVRSGVPPPTIIVSCPATNSQSQETLPSCESKCITRCTAI